MSEYLRLTYVHSSIGNSFRHKRTVRALGFRKLHQSRVVVDSPSLRGMLRSVAHLIKIEPAEPPVAPTFSMVAEETNSDA